MAQSVRQIFVGFVARSGTLPRELAIEEFSRIEGKTEDEYLTMFREGATFALRRADRRGLYSFYENAQNHAGFEVFIMEEFPRLATALEQLENNATTGGA